MRSSTLVVLVALALLSPPAAADLAAQSEDGAESEARGWISAGLGLGSQGLAGHAGLDVGVGKHLFSVRTATTSSVFFAVESYWDAGVLYGRAIHWDGGLAAASAGLGVMGDQSTAGYGDDVGARLGVPLAARMSWHPAAAFGLGLYVFGNVNGVEPFGGATLTIELGVLE